MNIQQLEQIKQKFTDFSKQVSCYYISENMRLLNDIYVHEYSEIYKILSSSDDDEERNYCYVAFDIMRSEYNSAKNDVERYSLDAFRLKTQIELFCKSHKSCSECPLCYTVGHCTENESMMLQILNALGYREIDWRVGV